MKNEDVTSIFALGGLGEVGKNMYVIEHKNEIVVIDAGVMFPESELLGIDYVIQDIYYLKQNQDKIKALIITHGHEDHIGGITFLIQNVQIPVIYASKIACDLINKKLEDTNISFNNLKEFDQDSILKFKYLEISFVGTTHSIPGSYAVVIKTPNGIIFETGDFKFDLTPIGPMAEIHKMAALGQEGVKILLADSTNACVPGYSNSESIVDEALNDVFARHTSRIIIATFASNIYRIKHIVETCKKYNRKIALFGRSMENTFHNDDRVIVNRLAVSFAHFLGNDYIPERGQIIVFANEDVELAKKLKQEKADQLGVPISEVGEVMTCSAPNNVADQYIIKRVVAFPGERVVVKDGIMTIYNEEFPDGKVYDEEFRESDMKGPKEYTSGEVDVVVPEGELFVSGDNREGSFSYDSRNGLGTVPYCRVVGPVNLRLFPLDKIGIF